MIIEEVRTTHLNDKNGMTDLDEDARTESSEGSNPQQQWAPEAADSEDEFVDAMEPPSSTSGTLVAFEGAAPPLSGVYEDALEATEEEVMAALESTGSEGSGGGRHATIHEEDATETEVEVGADDEVVAVVKGIVESVAAGEEHAVDLVDPSAEGVVTPVEVDVDAQVGEVSGEQETSDEAVDNVAEGEPSILEDTKVDADKEAEEPEGTAVDEVVKQDEAVQEENTVEEGEVDDATKHDVAEEKADNKEIEQAVEEMDDAGAEDRGEENTEDEPVVEKTTAGEQAQEVTAEGTSMDEAEVEKTAKTDKAAAGEEGGAEDEAVEKLTASVVAGLDTSADGADAITVPTMENIMDVESPENEVVGEAPRDEVAVDDAISKEVVVEIQETVVEDVPEADAAPDSAEAELAGDEEDTEVGVTVSGTAVDASIEQTGLDASEQEAASCVAEGSEDASVESVNEAASEEAELVATEKTTLEETAADELVPHEVSADEAAIDAAENVAIEGDGTEELVAEEVVEEESNTRSTEGFEDEQTDAAESDASPEESVAEVPGDDSAEIAATPEDDAIDASVEAIASKVKEITDELVEAVQSEQDQARESAGDVGNAEEATPEAVDVPEPKSEAASADKTVPEEDPIDNNVEAAAVSAQADAIAAEQNPAEEEVETAPVFKEVTGRLYIKSSDDNEQSHDAVVVGLLPRLEPSSGTTTTTTIEPFVLSSESNEVMEAHLPPQRWTYEVYGFSVESRVVFYHIHKTDRRTGIREPPLLKRYTDFRELQIQLLDTRLRAAADMPRIPRPHLGTVFRGYKSKKTIEVRENAFRAVLRYISQYPALHDSAVFERFITTSRASTGGAGWMM